MCMQHVQADDAVPSRVKRGVSPVPLLRHSSELGLLRLARQAQPGSSLRDELKTSRGAALAPVWSCGAAVRP